LYDSNKDIEALQGDAMEALLQGPLLFPIVFTTQCSEIYYFGKHLSNELKIYLKLIPYSALKMKVKFLKSFIAYLDKYLHNSLFCPLCPYLMLCQICHEKSLKFLTQNHLQKIKLLLNFQL
jgi:hypothetical protein